MSASAEPVGEDRRLNGARMNHMFDPSFALHRLRCYLELEVGIKVERLLRQNPNQSRPAGYLAYLGQESL